MDRARKRGVPFTLHEMHWGGFTRFSETGASGWVALGPPRALAGPSATVVLGLPSSEDAAVALVDGQDARAGRRGEERAAAPVRDSESPARRRGSSRAPSESLPARSECQRRHRGTTLARWRGPSSRRDDGPLIAGRRAGGGSPVLLLRRAWAPASTTCAISPTSWRGRTTSRGISSEGWSRRRWTGRTRWRRMSGCPPRPGRARLAAGVRRRPLVGWAPCPPRRGGHAGAAPRRALRRPARLDRRRTLAGVRRGDLPPDAGVRTRARA